MLRSTSGGGLSGTSYDRWSYEQSTRAGAGAHDTPLNKLQHKYWVTKSKVVRKLGKEEDECVVASDAELDSKLYLYKSIIETTMDLQRILEQYNDRLCSELKYCAVQRKGDKRTHCFCSPDTCVVISLLSTVMTVMSNNNFVS
jgi:hypothetical protein